MPIMPVSRVALLSLVASFVVVSAQAQSPHPSARTAVASPAVPAMPRVLVFTKGPYRHRSIEPGKLAVIELGKKLGFAVDTTEDAGKFTEANLKRYHAVFFLCTTGDVLNDAQQAAFMRFIQAGGGYMGMHSAADTEYEWPWYGKLTGAYFDGHPAVTSATVRKALPFGRNTLPDSIVRTDEWYNYRQISPDIKVIYTVDESTYKGGRNGPNHPIAWYHDFDGGRAFYTGFGHTPETFSEPLVLDLMTQALEYVIGKDIKRDYTKVTAQPFVEESRFTKTVLEFNLNEPMQMAMMPDGKILFPERRGGIKLYDPVTKKVKEINKLRVLSSNEDGLLGVALDPGFAKNRWLYLFYADSTRPVNVLSRFRFTKGRVDVSSEKRMLEIPQERQCCHSAGSMTFGPDGNLYLATGDNTPPGAFPSVDERPGHSNSDAQRSAGNTNDLRGKILRIRPQPDGSYTIPDGNLFPKGEPNTRPEIYTMGLRNPYRISIDQNTGFLYWGDVGPDAGEASPIRGSRGYDEINQARKAGFFGWPYFVGDNSPYAKDSLSKFADPLAPINDSPNNTGKRELPPANPAFIWYPYAVSQEFPMFKEGARTAMAGPIYHIEKYRGVSTAYPRYFDGKLVIYEFSRGWVFLVTMDRTGALMNIEPFMPSTKFSFPIDMNYGLDGQLYMLEYGRNRFTGNLDARLVRIDYNKGNRKPVAQLVADRTTGAIPLTVKFSAAGTFDPDSDRVTYHLDAAGKHYTSKDGTFTVTFTHPGVQIARLTVRDSKGAAVTKELPIIAGNAPPTVHIQLTGKNTMFYFPDTPADYAVAVQDKEDGSTAAGTILPEAVTVTMNYRSNLPQGTRSHQETSFDMPGKLLIAQNDCMNCHQFDKKSVGPSFTMVSEKYLTDRDALNRLAAKVIRGGNGVWGEASMAAHPQLHDDDARRIVEYVLSLAKPQVVTRVPLQGTLTPKSEEFNAGGYIISAGYSDKGNPKQRIPSLSASDMVVLRAPTITADQLLESRSMSRYRRSAPDRATVVGQITHGTTMAVDSMDFTGITSIAGSIYMLGDSLAGGEIELRLDRPDGQLLGTITFANAARTAVKAWVRPSAANPSTNPVQGEPPPPPDIEMLTASTAIAPVDGSHRLFLTFRNPAAGQKPLFYLRRLSLSNK